MTLVIRLLTPADAALVDRVGADIFDDTIVPAEARRLLADPRHLLVAALDGEAIVGFASAVEYFHPDKPPQLWVNEVGVAESHRGQGIGKRILAAALEEGRRRGCVEAWVSTEADNTAANALYRSMPEAGEQQTFVLYEFDLGSKP